MSDWELKHKHNWKVLEHKSYFKKVKCRKCGLIAHVRRLNSVNFCNPVSGPYGNPEFSIRYNRNHPPIAERTEYWVFCECLTKDEWICKDIIT